jgi:EAL and modified HD-GYP domain-containing signal transduction protein
MFQGYAIERPHIVRGATIAPSAVANVQLAMTMLSEELDFEELEEILRREPGLVVQILQMASIGSHRGLRRQVKTVREALVLMGTTRIRQWVALTILTAQPGGATDGLSTALTRARMAELVAATRSVDTPEVAFTAGLLSALDLLLGVDVAQLERTLDIDDALKSAAFRGEGPVGELVTEVIRYQETLDHGSGPGDGAGDRAGDLDVAAAAAFAWAAPFLHSLEPTSRVTGAGARQG